MSQPNPFAVETVEAARAENEARAAARRAVRRRWVAALAAVGALGTALALGPDGRFGTSPEDRQAKVEVEAQLKVWAQLQADETERDVSDAELSAAGIDPQGPGIQDVLADQRRDRDDMLPGTGKAEYFVRSVHRDNHGNVTAAAHRWTGYDFEADTGEILESGGSEGRLLTFVPPDDTATASPPYSLRLVRDVWDGHGHG